MMEGDDEYEPTFVGGLARLVSDADDSSSECRQLVPAEDRVPRLVDDLVITSGYIDEVDEALVKLRQQQKNIVLNLSRDEIRARNAHIHSINETQLQNIKVGGLYKLCNNWFDGKPKKHTVAQQRGFGEASVAPRP